MRIDYSKIICIYGPQGSGKTRHAGRLAKHYGCKRILEMDALDPPRAVTIIGKLKQLVSESHGVREGDLLLTNETPRFNKGLRYIHISQALREAGIEAHA